jgi:hypothetical protein
VISEAANGCSGRLKPARRQATSWVAGFTTSDDHHVCGRVSVPHPGREGWTKRGRHLSEGHAVLCACYWALPNSGRCYQSDRRESSANDISSGAYAA